MSNPAELSPAAKTYLDTEEQSLLLKCEQTIERGLVNFLETGKALLTIRDKKLYRAEYGDFASYCRKRWNIQRSYAYYLMAATTAVEILSQPIENEEMSTMVDILPTSERQIRPLQKLKDPDLQRMAWRDAVTEAGGGQPSDSIVQASVERYREEPKPVVIDAPVERKPARVEPASLTLSRDLERAAEQIVEYYDVLELRQLLALIQEKGKL